MSTRMRIGFVLMAVALACLIGPVQAANWTNSVKTGDWNTPANWNPNDVPDTVTEPALLTNSLNAGPYTCRVDAVMYPSGLTCGAIRNENRNSSAAEAGAKVLVAADLTLNVGNLANPANISVDKSPMLFSNVILNVEGPALSAIDVSLCMTSRTWAAQFIDSALTLSASTGVYVHGVLSTGCKGGSMSMEGGSLVATNGLTNCMIRLGVAENFPTPLDFDKLCVLSLKRTKLNADLLVMQNTSHFIFDGAGASGASCISSNLDIISKGGRVTLKSGTLAIGRNITASNASASGDPLAFVQMIVTGSTVTVGGDIQWYGGGTTVHTLQKTNTLDIYEGSMTVGGNIHMGMRREPSYDPEWAIRIFGGSLTVSNTIRLGTYISSFGGSPHGKLKMYGGFLTASNLVVGYPGNANGYYTQTGGTNTVTGILTLQATNAGYACQQFVVGSNATLILRGRGMAKEGAGAWSTNLLTDANLSFAGTTVYDPQGVSRQTNYVFGRDIGAVVDGLTNLGAVGTWDLSALDGIETLKVVAAGNETTNAVYVRSLIGPADGIPSNHLQSAVNVYYDPRYSSSFSSTDILLSGNGHLKAISITTAGTLMYVQ